MDQSARFRRAVSDARPRGKRLIEAYSLKLGRRLQLFDETCFRQWICLEADPSIQTFCERPVFLDLANGRQLADFWVRKKDSEHLLIIEDKYPGFTVAIGDTELPVYCVTTAELAATRIWINNWERMLPVIISSLQLSGPSLQQAVLKFISTSVSLGRIEQELAVGDPSLVRAALFDLLRKGMLQAPRLISEPLSFSTCFEPLRNVP